MNFDIERLIFLLKKHNKETCSGDEIEELTLLLEEIPDKDLTILLNQIESNIKLEPLQNTEKKLTFNFIIKNIRKKTLFHKLRPYAAILILFIGIGFFYFEKNGVRKDDIIQPSTLVTIKSDFGERELILSDTVSLKNSAGKEIGIQLGKRLVYFKNEDIIEDKSDTLFIPNGKTFELKLADGTDIHLNAGARIIYPQNFSNKKERRVQVSGEAYFDVAKDTIPFIVEGAYSRNTVLGTKFNFTAYPEDNYEEIVLVTGSLKMESEKAKENTALLLKPGEKGRYEKTSDSFSKTIVKVDPYLAWMNGDLIFKNMSFEEIIKKLERRYDKRIIIENESLKSQRFSLNLDDVTLYDVLNYFELVYGIEYKTKGQSVIIK